MSSRAIQAADLHSRPSNQMKVSNTDVARKLDNALEMSDEELAFLYPDGPKAPPIELGGVGAS